MKLNSRHKSPEVLSICFFLTCFGSFCKNIRKPVWSDNNRKVFPFLLGVLVFVLTYISLHFKEKFCLSILFWIREKCIESTFIHSYKLWLNVWLIIFQIKLRSGLSEVNAKENLPKKSKNRSFTSIGWSNKPDNSTFLNLFK